MPNNSISIDGNNNLVIQGVEGSQVYINSDEGVQRLLQEQGDKIEQILQSLESQPSALSQQWAEKIYNIQQAGPIHFHIYGECKIPKILIPAGAEVPASFLGRETEKNKIWQLLFLRSRSLALVNAEGGMGKTTLAAYYWQQYAKEYQHLAWLYCESGIVNAMLNQLPTALGILDDINAALKQAAHTGQNLQDAQWQTLKRALSNLKAPCLLVLDNANNPADIRFFLQQSKGLNWHILLTSRCAGVMADAQSEYRITGLPPDLAKQLFTSNYTEPGPEFEALLERFLKAIGYNTLCIEIFSKNLKANEGWGDLTMAGLLAKLETQSLYLGEASFAINSDWGNPANVRSSDDIIAALYDIVALGQARPTLHQTLATLALLPAEQHPAAVLRQLLPAESPAALKKQLDELQSLGWLAATEGAYRISPVVQKMVLQELSPEQRWVLGEPLVQRLQVVFEAEGYHPKNIATAAPFAELVEGLAANLGLANEDLILLFDRLWVYYKATGKLAQALVCAGQMGELCREVGDKNGMVSSYTNLGETHRSLGNLKQTLTFFQENLGLTKELYEDFPDNVEFKKRLASSHQFLGITHNTLGNLRQALAFFKDQTKLFEALHADFPDNVEFKNGLASSYGQLGDTYRAQGDLQQTLAFFEDTTKLFEELYNGLPNNIEFKNNLAISYEKLGDTHSDLGNLQQALTFFEQRNQLGKELYTAYPDNVSFKNGLAISYEKLGSTHSALGNLPKALTFFELDIGLSKELYAAFSDNVEFKNGLAVSYSKLGMIQLLQDKLDLAFTAFELYCQLCQELHTLAPDNLTFHANYAEALAVSAAMHRLNGLDAGAELSTARQHFISLHQEALRGDYLQRKIAIIEQMQTAEGAALRDLIIAISGF